MLVRRVVVATFVSVIAVGASAQTVDVTGTWMGSASGVVSCTGGGSATYTISLSLNLQQSGPNISGSGSTTGPIGNGVTDPCVSGNPSVTSPITSVSATISGSQIDGTITVATATGSKTKIIQATVSGSTMAFTLFFDATNSVQVTLTKAAPPSVDLTGSWGGTFNATENCGSGGTISWSSPTTLALVQQQASVTGAVILYSAAMTTDQCGIGERVALVLPLTGSVSGSTLSGTVITPDGPNSQTLLTATVTGNSLTLQGPAKISGSGTLTRNSSAAPDSHLSGTYAGGFSETFIPCFGTTAQLPAMTISGTVSGSVTQVGQALYATLTVSNGEDDMVNNGTCVVTDTGGGQGTLSGLVSGSALTGFLFPDHPGGKTKAFNATISGNTVTGQQSGQGKDVTFTLTRTGSTAAPPQILSFVATPPAIRTGQQTTLSWSTSAATAVTIDNGVGNQPSSGSVTVSPSAATTYTLTATQGSQSATATVTVNVLSGPIVNVTVIPATMLQLAGSSGAATAYALTNSGSASTNITLAQNGSFFTQSPATFKLDAGATQIVSIVATAQPQGTYEGASMASASGIPPVQVAVKLVAAPAPTGTVTADPAASRVDVAAAGGASPSGSVSFKNNGTARLIGVLNSDAPWILPQGGTVTIDPGQTASFTFNIDRTQRPDGSAPVGSAEGNLTLSFLSGGGSSFAKRPLDGTSAVPSVTLVKVVDTVQPSVSTTGIPALAAGEVALFVAGVGHVTGTGGALFVSDVSILNPQGSKSIDDLKMYYTPTTGSATAAKTTSLPSVPGQVSVAVADVVKNVFAGSEERGTLQLRSKDADKLAMSATVLTTNNPAGTYGNTIPVFRSDRAIGAGDAYVLTGVRQDNTTHTNLYIQEAAGSAASVQTDFLASDGSTVNSRTDPIDPFKLLALDNVVPANAVAAVITNKSSGGATIIAYATPVDVSSGDTWAITDWSRVLGYSPTDPMIIPVAGSVHGANNTFYRTELALTNRGTDPATTTLRYTSRTGSVAEQQVALASKQTTVMTDVIGSFSITGDTVGFLSLTPLTGRIAVSSRTFTTVGTKPGTFGSGVPAIAAASALRMGGSRAIAGLADAARTTVVAGKPATFRTNFALMEVSGQPVTVRVTFRFTFPAGEKVQGTGAASRDYTLNAGGFLLLNSIAGEILGPARLQYGDLSNVEADFQVVSGSGAVVMFTSSVDNGTGDSIVRTE